MNPTESLVFDLDGIHGVIAGSRGEFEITLTGELNGTLSAWVMDFGDGAAIRLESDSQRLGVITPAVLARHQSLRAPWHEFEDNGWSKEDRLAIATSLVSVVHAEDDSLPPAMAEFPGAFDLPDIEPWRVTWDGPDGFAYSCPGPEGADTWSRYHGTVQITGDHASWSTWFMENMLHSPEEDGWAAWTADRLLVAGVSDDIDDRGYLSLRLTTPFPRIETAEWDRWRVALARAITMRGDAANADPYNYGFKPFIDG